MRAAAGFEPAGVQSMPIVPSAIPESMSAVTGFQSAPPARAWSSSSVTPDPLTDHVVVGGGTSGVCAASDVLLAPVNVSRTATVPVSTVTVAAPLGPCVGVAVIVAVPPPSAMALAVVAPTETTATADGFELAHEKFMPGMTPCAAS